MKREKVEMQKGVAAKLWRRFGVGSVAAVTLIGLASCSSAEDWKRGGLPEPSTEEAPIVLNMWVGSWIALLGVGLLVWGLLIWSIIVYRKRSDKLPKQTKYHLPLEILYTVVPVMMIGVIFAYTAKGQDELLKEGHEERTVEVVAFRWNWTFNYLEDEVYNIGTPDEHPDLILEEGVPVRFELVSPDVIHSFWVPTFLMKMDAIPGRTNSFVATPNRLGTFAGKCAEYCGVDHSRMLFNVKVVDSATYQEEMQKLADAGKTGRLNAEKISERAQGV